MHLLHNNIQTKKKKWRHGIPLAVVPILISQHNGLLKIISEMCLLVYKLINLQKVNVPEFYYVDMFGKPNIK